MMKCENCAKKHDGNYASGRFCSSVCARSFSTKEKRSEINKKVSSKLSGRKLSVEHRNKSLKILGVKPRPLRSIICHGCGIRFETKSESRKYCSYDCWKSLKRMLRDKYEEYRVKCSFQFNVYDYPDHFDLGLLRKHGWYSASNRKNNLTGVSRDHIISISEGYKKSIPPEMLSHPANCKLLLHEENNKKNTRSDLTYEELLERINKFNDELVQW